MPIGGDIIEVTYNHPTIGSGTINVKAAEDSTYETGGLRSNDDDNSITGNGSMIDQMNRVRPFFEVTATWDMLEAQDLEKCVQMAASPVKADWTIENANGTVYGMRGKPVGALQGNGNASTFTLKVAGDGSMKKIVG